MTEPMADSALEVKRSRGRPPGLRKLLTDVFPHGATKAQLEAAGYTGDPLKEPCIRPPQPMLDLETGIYSLPRASRGRPPLTDEQRASAAKGRLRREAEQIGMALVPITEAQQNTENSLQRCFDDGFIEYAPGCALEMHPYCMRFPRMTGDEFDELANDIRQHGQRQPGTILDGKVLDGWDRYLACEQTGRPFRARQYDGDDPLAFVISANIRRRHLTGEQKRQLIAVLLKDNPERSDRAIARDVGVSKNTVAAERAEQESRGQIDHVDHRTDTKGREQPAHKSKQMARQALHWQGERMNQSPLQARRARCRGAAGSARHVEMLAKPHDDDAGIMRIPRDPKKFAFTLIRNWSREDLEVLRDAIDEHLRTINVH